MPYSVRGLGELHRLTASMDVRFIPLLDPGADPLLARQVIREHGWPSAWLARLDSARLFDRGVTLHYPTLVVFREGVVVEPLLPGYVTKGTYDRFIRAALL